MPSSSSPATRGPRSRPNALAGIEQDVRPLARDHLAQGIRPDSGWYEPSRSSSDPARRPRRHAATELAGRIVEPWPSTSATLRPPSLPASVRLRASSSSEWRVGRPPSSSTSVQRVVPRRGLLGDVLGLVPGGVSGAGARRAAPRSRLAPLRRRNGKAGPLRRHVAHREDARRRARLAEALVVLLDVVDEVAARSTSRPRLSCRRGRPSGHAPTETTAGSGSS